MIRPAVYQMIDCHILQDTDVKVGCVFPMVIWPEFRIGQYRVNNGDREDAQVQP